MQCYESIAIRLKMHGDLCAIQPGIPFDELVLSDLMSDFSISSFAKLTSLSRSEYQKLLNEALFLMDMPSKIAA